MPPRRTNSPDPKKLLAIKVRACERLVKEARFYKREAAENEAKLAKMKEEGGDPYDIKKFEEVLGESYMMVPDSAKRLDKNLEDLGIFVDLNSQLDGEYMEKAKKMLEEFQTKDKAQETVVEGDDAIF